MRFLIAGLGNIGDKYTYTRHNIGFHILDRLAEKENFEFESGRYAFIAKKRIKNRVFYYIKPTTLMNNSGKAVRYWMNYLKLPLENILVLVDDIALPLGQIRIRPKGGDGGHNGLHDIIYYLNSGSFARLRFGVGNNFSKGKQVGYVLGEWDEEELQIINSRIDKAHDAIRSFAFEGLTRTMTFYNSDK